jgi:hypothetical protein
MPDIFIFADPIAYPQLKNRLKGEFDRILAENIAPAMNKLPGMIKSRLIAVETGTEVANIQIMLTSTVIMDETERVKMSEKCAEAIVHAWQNFTVKKTLEGVTKVDTQVFYFRESGNR